MGIGDRAANIFAERTGLGNKWYCTDPNCNGEPHAGWHWCDHPIDSPNHTWECRHCRADQRPPPQFVDGEASIWLQMAGRGFGKTRSGSEWLADQARRNPRTHWGVLAPTNDDIRETCIEGESGLLNALGWDRDDDRYNKTTLLLRLDNGATIKTYSAESPRKVRGPNLYGVWLEEIAQWKSHEMWDNLMPAVRRGKAQTVVTTTPDSVEILFEWAEREDGSVVITRGSTFDNTKNLSPNAVRELEIRWKGTRKEKQELYGELLRDVPGALWKAETIEKTRAVLID